MWWRPEWLARWLITIEFSILMAIWDNNCCHFKISISFKNCFIHSVWMVWTLYHKLRGCFSFSGLWNIFTFLYVGSYKGRSKLTVFDPGDAWIQFYDLNIVFSRQARWNRPHINESGVLSYFLVKRKSNMLHVGLLQGND